MTLVEACRKESIKRINLSSDKEHWWSIVPYRPAAWDQKNFRVWMEYRVYDSD